MSPANAPACTAAGALAALLLSLPAHAVAPSGGQHCDTSQYPLSAPAERFEDAGDGAVIDRVSRRMWLRCAAGQHWNGQDCIGEPERLSWPQAQQRAAEINAQGTHFFSDWRLPQLPELAALTERQCVNPRINLTIFPATPAAAFWTASARDPAAQGGPMLMLDFGEQGVGHDPQDAPHYVRFVRDGR